MTDIVKIEDLGALQAELEKVKREFAYATKAFKAEEESWRAEEERLCEANERLILLGNSLAEELVGMLDTMDGQDAFRGLEAWRKAVDEMGE